METVDLTKVAGFQAVDSEGNVLGTVSMEQLTDSIAMRIADGLSERTVLPANNVPMAVAVTSTGSDKMETAFSETTDPAYVRVIDKNGNSAKQGISSLATVVGGLIGAATTQKSGLITSVDYTSLKKYCGDSTYMVADISGETLWRMNYLEVLVSSTDINNYCRILIMYVNKGSSVGVRAIKLSGNITSIITVRVVNNKLYLTPSSGYNMYITYANKFETSSGISGGQTIEIE